MCYKIIRIKVGIIMKLKKIYVVLAALVLALGTAVYVNWQFNENENTSAKELGAASYVNATLPSSTDDEAVKTSSLTTDQQNYFSSERTKRKAMQDEVIDKAYETLKIEDADEDDMTEAQREITEILKYFTIQDSIESIIKAKGFSECLCYITEDEVTIIVPDGELDDTSVLVIDDAVTSHYQVAYEDISIVGA